MAITKVSSGLISADASSIDLNIDAGTLYLDVSENRVGIGTTSPSTKLHVYTTAGRDFKVDQGTANKTILSNDYGLTLKAGGGYNLDLDTGNASGTVRFLDNGSETMRIDSSGNLSVGTTSNPDSRKFRVYGISEIDGAGVSLQVYKSSGTKIGSAGQGNYVISGGPSTGFGIQAENDLVFGSNGTTERMRIDSSGNVGIGTNSPSANLSLGKSIGYNADSALFSDISINDSAVNNNAVYRWRTGMTGNATGHSLTFSTLGRTESSYVERMRIDSSGNVGIGGTGTARLVVQNDGNCTVSITSNDGGLATLNLGDASDSSRGQIVYDNSNESLKFSTNNLQERMRIDSSGNVGIGNTGPTNALDITRPSGTKTAIRLLQTGYESWEVGIPASNTALTFANSGSERMRIDSLGRVLIGHTAAEGGHTELFGINTDASSGFGMFISGNSSGGTQTAVRFYDSGASAGVVGSITFSTDATSFNTSSDARLKDVTGAARGLEVINELNPVAYNWKKTGQADEGLIAQEVLDIVPNAVTGSEEDMYSMDYSKLVVHLVAGMKEQQTIIDDLKTRIETLENV